MFNILKFFLRASLSSWDKQDKYGATDSFVRCAGKQHAGQAGGDVSQKLLEDRLETDIQLIITGGRQQRMRRTFCIATYF